MEIRKIKSHELESLLELYTHLHNNEIPIINSKLIDVWDEILMDKNHHIIACFENGKPVSSCVVIIVPNLTHNQRPYAVIENVVTHCDYRKKGYATKALNYAKEIADNKQCYKIMLMTGAKEEGVLRLYENAGFNRTDKTAFIMWL